MTTFYLFRHGQTIWNAEGRPHGQDPYPVPLTLQGREQVGVLADKLKDKNISLLISSDQLRAQQTAEIIAEKLQLKIIYDADLREVDYGKLNGLYTLEREEVFPDFKKCYTDYNFPFPDGESFNQAASRLRSALVKLAKNYSDLTLGISTHGKLVDVFLELVFKKRFQKLGNCGFIAISYDVVQEKFTPILLPDEFIYYG